jgi:integrase/recombinase XerD
VVGKGNKERTIPLNTEVVTALEKYLQSRPEVSTDKLFVSRKGNGLSSGAVYHLVKTYISAAGIKKDKVGVHSLRHTFATSLLGNNRDIKQIMKLLGHKKLETTSRYLHVSDADLRSAVNSLVLKPQ